MTTYDLNAVEVAGSVRRIAHALPQYSYMTPDGGSGPGVNCLYVHDDTPGCIVGHALHAHGVPLEVLAQHEGTSVRRVVENLTGKTGTLSPNEIDALAFMGWVQQLQDAGWPWGRAVDFADMADKFGTKRFITTTHYDEEKRDWVEQTKYTFSGTEFVSTLLVGPEHTVAYGDAVLELA